MGQRYRSTTVPLPISVPSDRSNGGMPEHGSQRAPNVTAVRSNLGLLCVGREVLVGNIMRRLLICVLVLGLTVMAASPLSLCAMFSSLAGDCATPQTQARCHQMETDSESSQTLSTPSSSCCLVAQNPVPEPKVEATRTFPYRQPANVIALAAHVVSAARARFAGVMQDLAPPSLQPLLCTFLI
jgi:hypothetical protein